MANTKHVYDWVRRAAAKYWFNQDLSFLEMPPIVLNNEAISGVNAAGTGVVNLIKADTSDDIRVGGTAGTIVKIFNRPTTDVIALQVKSEYTATTGTHNCLEVTADWHPSATATAGGNTAVQGVSRLHTSHTMTGGSLLGTYGQVQNLGTLNGGGIMVAAIYGVVTDGGTWTAVSHVASGWFDSQLAQTVSAGQSELLYLTNNGATTLNSVFFVYPGNKITNLFTIDPTDTGMVSGKTAGAATITQWYSIKCSINGETKYLIAGDIA